MRFYSSLIALALIGSNGLALEKATTPVSTAEVSTDKTIVNQQVGFATAMGLREDVVFKRTRDSRPYMDYSPNEVDPLPDDEI